MSPEEYLSQFPTRVQDVMSALRALVQEAAPDAAERVIPGWNIIAYQHKRVFCYIGPHRDRVALGFNWGIFLPDPRGLMSSASGAKYSRSLYLTSVVGVDADGVKELVEAASVNSLISVSLRK